MRECQEYKFLKESFELNCNLGGGNRGGGGVIKFELNNHFGDSKEILWRCTFP